MVGQQVSKIDEKVDGMSTMKGGGKRVFRKMPRNSPILKNSALNLKKLSTRQTMRTKTLYDGLEGLRSLQEKLDIKDSAN